MYKTSMLGFVSSLLLLSHPMPADAENRVFDTIGSTKPYCRKQFEEKFPDRKSEVEKLSQSVLLLTCGDSVASATYVDTPSKRIIVTAEHAVSNYAWMKDKYVLGAVRNPYSCMAQDLAGHDRVGIDKNYAVQFGHPPRTLSLDATTDWMVMVLQKPLNVERLHINQEAPIADSDMLIVGARGYLLDNKHYCSTVVACRGHSLFNKPPRPAYYKTDCSNGPGAPVIIKGKDGNDVVAAISNGTTRELPNGSPFDKDRMFQGSIAITSAFLDAVQRTETEIEKAPDR